MERQARFCICKVGFTPKRDCELFVILLNIVSLTRMAKKFERRKNLYSRGDGSSQSTELGRRVAKGLPRLPRSPNRSAQKREISVPGLNLWACDHAASLMVIGQEPTQSLAALHGPLHQSVQLDVINRDRWSPSLGAPRPLSADVCLARDSRTLPFP